MQYSNKKYKKFMLTFIMSVFFTQTLPTASFASSDVVYDFGVQSESPVVSSTNPALMANCGSQIMSGINTRKVDFELESGENLPGFSESEDKDYSFGSIYFGVCSEFLRWLSYGVFVNANALSFEFRTQNENNPLVFPYGKDGLPVASGGLAIKVIEPLSVGFAWKIVEKVDIDIRLPVELADALQLEIDADIRPDLSWVLGGAFRFQDFEFYYAYSPEVRGNLDVVFDVPLDFGFAAFDVGAFDIQTAISFVPAQNRIGVLGAYQGFDYDVGLVQNQWSKFSDPFLNVDLIGSLDTFFFNEFPIQLEDTIEPYVLLSKRFGDTRLGAGYSYRRNPVKDIDNNEPLVGADMHAFKFTGEQKLYVFQKSFTFGAEAVIGLMDSSKSANRTQSLDGYFVNLQSYIKVPL